MNFIIQKLNFPQKIYKLNKTNTFFSRFEGTRGEKTQIFRTTDRSAKDIQRSIKSAIRELSTTNNTTGNGNGIPDDETSHNNITEEIAAELTVCKFFRQTMTVHTVILEYFNVKK